MRILEYRYIVAVIYAVVLFLDRLDLTIVNIALPAIAAHFDVLITDTEWINNAFLLALALSIPISGWIGDRFGDKRVFVSAIILFGVTSLLCALAPSIEFLIAMRFIQGLAGGLIVPVGMTMVFRVFEPAEYASISSYIFIPSLIAPAIAPSLGGLMIYYLNWKWVFLFATPVCVIAVIFSLCWLKEHKERHTANLDGWGFLFSASTLLLIFYVLSSLGAQGITWKNGCLCALSLFFGYLFIQQERRAISPLIDLKFFHKRLFVQANLIQMLFQMGHFGAIFLIAIFLQLGVGHTAMEAGMIMGMQALGSMCTSRLSVTWFHRYSAKRPIITGLLGIGLITPLILLLNETTPLGFALGILFVRGLFSGLCGAPMQTIGILGFDAAEVSRVAAVYNIIRQLSISLGIAMSSLLLSFAIHDSGVHDFRLLADYDKTVFYGAFLLISLSVFLGAFVASRLDNRKIRLFLKSKAR
ncbi:MAG: hypothetical protein CK423_09475 [Legionella sp.]|nr:MAG: hypothetical protein CK423_09475 [Legionella sp.]